MTIEAGTTYLVDERQSIVKPPLFVGDNYAYWKIRIKLFIQATDYEAWRVIVNGPTILKKVGDEEVIKEESEWDANDLKLAQLNAKAMYSLFCALGAN